MGILFKFSIGNVPKIADVGLFQTPSLLESAHIGIWDTLPPKNGQHPLWMAPNCVSTCLSIIAFIILLTDGIFENGAYRVPNKSQNPTVLGQGGPSSTSVSRTGARLGDP